MTADHPVRPWFVTDPCACTKPGRAPDLSPAEVARVAEFDAAPEPPESSPVVRAVLALADELDEDSRDALKIGAAARDRGDREVHRISARHARVAHHAASQLRAAITTALAGQHTTDEEADRG